jgi:hypothetical protein
MGDNGERRRYKASPFSGQTLFGHHLPEAPGATPVFEKRHGRCDPPHDRLWRIRTTTPTPNSTRVGAGAVLLDACTRHGCIVLQTMPRWLIPWVVPVVIVVAVIAGATGGVWALVAVFIAAAAVLAWLRLRQLDAAGQRDEVSYTRLSDLLRRRR